MNNASMGQQPMTDSKNGASAHAGSADSSPNVTDFSLGGQESAAEENRGNVAVRINGKKQGEPSRKSDSAPESTTNGAPPPEAVNETEASETTGAQASSPEENNTSDPATATGSEGPQAEGSESELLARLDETTAKAQQYQEAYLRASADLENFRRRMAREKEELRKFAMSGLIEDLLPAIDNLSLGLDSARKHHPEAKAVTDGVDMVLTQIKNILGQHGVEELNPVGAPFDPQFHESVSHIPSEEVEEGKVITVTRLGYVLNNRLIRPASVVVSSGPPPTANP